MIRSLKLRLFLIILALTVVMIWTNREFAISKTRARVQAALHSEMQIGLTACSTKMESLGAFLACYKVSAQDGLIRHLSDEFTLCNSAPSPARPEQKPVCALAAKSQDFGSDKDISTAPQVQLVVSRWGEETWHAARLTAQPEIQLLVSEQSFQNYMKAIWKVRDDQLPASVPLLLLLITVMTFFLTRTTMAPFETLQASLKGLSSETLSSTQAVTTQYKEFEEFLTVYAHLRQRLNESFIKARRFSSDAAHELRTPLSILRGHAELLIADAPEGSDLQKRIRKMADEIERLIDMSEKLLLLSKADAQSISQENAAFRLSHFFNRLAQDSLTYHPNLTVKKFIAPELIWHCNQSLVQQLIHNLYTNAVKYNTPKGWIKFSLKRDGDALELSLENPTTAVPADLTQKAFDRFYRGDQARNREIDGMGLGLSICKEIAALHQGTLTLEVTPEKTVIARLRAPLQPSPRT